MIYFCDIRRNTLAMLLIVLYCGFYLSGLLIARWLTLPRQALVSGVTVSGAAALASLTLWLLARPAFIEPWLAIAMGGAVALPALLFGLGLLAGWWVRHRSGSRSALAAAAVLPVMALLIPLIG